MMNNPIIMNGKELADKITLDLEKRVQFLKERGIHPELIIITANQDNASKIYVRNKIKKCDEIGIKCEHIVVPKLTVDTMEYVQGRDCPVIVQMPFESDELTVNDLGAYISAENDVDGFINVDNVAALAMNGFAENYPCTPFGIMNLLDYYGVSVKGRSVAVFGRSNAVGRPMARMLEHQGATVTLCHSKTDMITKFNAVKNADIVVSAVGKRNTIDWSWAKDIDNLCFKTFVDVGINRDENGKICGDIDPKVLENCKQYTPVPGGVGPMTVITLMMNVIRRYERMY